MTEKVYKEDVLKDALDSLAEGIANRLSVKISEREKQAIKDLICHRIKIFQCHYETHYEAIARMGDHVFHHEKHQERATIEMLKQAAAEEAFEQEIRSKYFRGKKFTIMFFK